MANQQNNVHEPQAKKFRSLGESNKNNKRHCISSACIACRKRKSKCDGQLPSCATCKSVYETECIYDPNSDHRRKGVYKEKIDSLRTRNSTLQTLIQAILNADEDDVPSLVRRIRTCESLDIVAEEIIKQQQGIKDEEYDDEPFAEQDLPVFETQLSGKMGELRLENGSVRFLGGTSNLIYLPPTTEEASPGNAEFPQQMDLEDSLISWSTVTRDRELVLHLINLYFTYHFPFFTTLSKDLFYGDFLLGKRISDSKRTSYCSSLLINAMLSLGCHFTSSPQACSDPSDPGTKGDAFFAEAKRLIRENEEYERPRLTTVQAFALMSVREAGCGREQKGWVYSGMSFRMAQDLGLNLDSGGITASKETMDEEEIDARRITFWGCFLFDKCWSNYLGRLPQLPTSNVTVPKYDVFPNEESGLWSPYNDSGISQTHSQPTRTRAIALQILLLAEISSDLLMFFYHPQHIDKPVGKSAELKKLSELHGRLENWKKECPREFESKEGQLPNVLLMHMFFHLLYIHLFRPFLKYSPQTSPLPANVSPRKLCTHAAFSISKIMRCYQRTYGLRQICNIAVYFLHSACTIHLLALPDKTAKRDIVHGLKHLETMGEDWLCARRTLSILSVLARKWKVELPEEATVVLVRTDAKFGFFSTGDVPSSRSSSSYPRIIHDKTGNTTFQKDIPQPSLTTSQFPGITNPVGISTTEYEPTVDPSYMPPKSNISSSSNIDNMILPSGVMPPNNNTHHLPASSSNFTESLPSTSIQTPQRTLPGNITSGVSPNSFFRGANSLVENQDWWLGEQTSLVAGFDNWNGMDASMVELGGESGGNNGGYIIPGDDGGNELAGEEWFT